MSSPDTDPRFPNPSRRDRVDEPQTALHTQASAQQRIVEERRLWEPQSDFARPYVRDVNSNPNGRSEPDAYMNTSMRLRSPESTPFPRPLAGGGTAGGQTLVQRQRRLSSLASPGANSTAIPISRGPKQSPSSARSQPMVPVKDEALLQTHPDNFSAVKPQLQSQPRLLPSLSPRLQPLQQHSPQLRPQHRQVRQLRSAAQSQIQSQPQPVLDAQSQVQRPQLVQHSASYIRRPRYSLPAPGDADADVARMQLPRYYQRQDRSHDVLPAAWLRESAENVGIPEFGRMHAQRQMNEQRYDNGQIQENEGLGHRLKAFFERITAEPELVSPPPSKPVSRSGSFSGVGASERGGGEYGEGGRGRERAWTVTGGGNVHVNVKGPLRSQDGRGKEVRQDSWDHPDPYGNAMFLRTIEMNGETERAQQVAKEEAEVDLGDGEADGVRHEELGGRTHQHHVTNLLRNRKNGSKNGQGCDLESNRNATVVGERVTGRGRAYETEEDAEAETVVSTPYTTSTAWEDEKKLGFVGPGNSNGANVSGQQGNYRQRRKRRKHQIVYNRDSVDAQQRFILTLSKALLVFGSISHRIEPQLASVAAVFELPAQFSHTPGCIQVSFGDPEHRGSQTLFIKATSTLDLGRIHETHKIYRRVVRDEISASEGRRRLEELLARGPLYGAKAWIILTFIQAFILCGTGFGGSLNDMWVAGILGSLVAIAQKKAARSELSSSGADIFIAAIVSFTARALSLRVPGRIFCYQSISSASVTGLLPGSLMLAGVLDIASRNIFLGAPKLVSGLLTSLYLGFGLTLGSDIWLNIDRKGQDALPSAAGHHNVFTGSFTGTNATTPAALALSNLTGVFAFTTEKGGYERQHTISGCFRDPNYHWFLQPLPWYSLFVLLPVLNLVHSLKRNQPWRTREMPVMIIISCISNAVTKVGNHKFGLSGHPDYGALVGSFIVSMLGNLWSRKFGGTAFTVMLTGIWLMIPTGLAEAGGLASSYYRQGEDEYTSSLTLARKMISVTIGVMSGVYLSARIVYTFGKKKNSALVTF